MKKKVVSMKFIHDLEYSFSNKSLIWLSINIHDVCIYFWKKTLSHMHCWFYLYKEFTRHLSVEWFWIEKCFECFKKFHSNVFIFMMHLIFRWFHAIQFYTNKFLILSFGFSKLTQFNWTHLFSSPEPKAQVSISDHNLSVVRRCHCCRRRRHCR